MISLLSMSSISLVNAAPSWVTVSTDSVITEWLLDCKGGKKKTKHNKEKGKSF